MNTFQEARMEKIRNSISDISFPFKKWRYLVLFQSWAQATSWIVTLLACIVLITYFFSLDKDNKAPLEVVLLSAAIGSSFSLMAVFPAKFLVCGNVPGMRGEIEVRLLKMSYVEEKRLDRIVVYRQNLPRLLRWDEGNITISDADGVFTVSGGYIGVRALRSKLKKE